MKNVDFGLALQYAQGVRPNVAINRAVDGAVILEVHQSRRYKNCTLWSRMGIPAAATVVWAEQDEPYAEGVNPAVALNSRNVAVEVHVSPSDPTLTYIVGSIQGDDGVKWHINDHDRRFGRGSNPHVAVNDGGVVVVLHESEPRLEFSSPLWCGVGVIEGEKIDFGKFHAYDVGVNPAVAINIHGTVVEVHQGHDDDTLWYRVGEVKRDEKNIAWGKSHSFGSGTQPSVALADDGFVIVAHQSGGALWRRVGQIDGKIIAWRESSYFDDGEHPSVATNGKLAIQVHQSENFRTLLFSTALVTDRAGWMENRLMQLGERTLKDLALPASHDAGMYLGSGSAALGRTQDLSIYGQLLDGIRYFDLRPRWNAKEGKFFITHGPIEGPPLDSVLKDIQRFMMQGHKELAILKFSHYDNFDDQLYRDLVACIGGYLAPWLYYKEPFPGRLAQVPLREFLSGDKGVALVVCDGAYPVRNKRDGIWIYRDWEAPDADQGQLRVYDRYSNTIFYNSMQPDQMYKFAEYNGKCRDSDIPCDLFLLSWTLTPPTRVWTFSKPANRNLGQAILEFPIPNRDNQIVNLVYVDYVEYSRVTDVCLYLNNAPFPDDVVV